MLQLALGIALLIAFALLAWHDRRNIERESVMFIRRTTHGLRLLDRLSRIPGLKLLYTLSIPICILFMLLILLMVATNAAYILTTPGAAPGLSPVIPGVKVPGAPFYVPFSYGIIGLSILLLVHETSHGIAARLGKIKVKSAGLILALIIPGAFVEPDERQFKRAKTIRRLRLAAAGSFANFVTAFLCILAVFLIFSYFPARGVIVTSVINGTPASGAFTNVTVVTAVDGQPVKSFDDMYAVADRTVPNQTLLFSITTLEGGKVTQIEKEITTIPAPNNSAKGFVGIPKSGAVYPLPKYLFLTLAIQPMAVIKAIEPVYWTVPEDSLLWPALHALKWTAFLNMAIGLVNLLPLGPLDGGQMVTIIGEKYAPKHAKKISKVLTTLILALFLVNLLPYFT